MSWDIYGNPLKRGHCEVHPGVAEEHPCSICVSDSNAKQLRQEIQEALEQPQSTCVLSKRELIAAMAMQGILAAGGIGPETGMHAAGMRSSYLGVDDTVRESVRYADSLLAELEK